MPDAKNAKKTRGNKNNIFKPDDERLKVKPGRRGKSQLVGVPVKGSKDIANPAKEDYVLPPLMRAANPAKENYSLSSVLWIMISI